MADDHQRKYTLGELLIRRKVIFDKQATRKFSF